MSGDLEATQQESEWTSVFSIRAGAFQSFAMLLFGQFLHVSDGIALIDNFLTEQCFQSVFQGHYACGLTVFILDHKEMHLVSDEEIDEFMHGQFV